LRKEELSYLVVLGLVLVLVLEIHYSLLTPQQL
jgi:hypothetical protein